MRDFPALDLIWSAEPTGEETELAFACLDDFEPSAIDDRPCGIRVFFPSSTLRDQALTAATAQLSAVTCTPLSVPDEGWAERSQAALKPVTIGWITVAPPWAASSPLFPNDKGVTIIIPPSMGFGTGHHASTRRCLALLQRHAAENAPVLDVGTGSGVLAIASWKLGASHALGIDCDADALASAAESIEINHAHDHVMLAVCDITRDVPPDAGRYALAFANLTGSMLIRTASALVATLASHGVVIASGFQTHEREDVVAAFSSAGAAMIDEDTEDSWVGAAFQRSS